MRIITKIFRTNQPNNNCFFQDQTYVDSDSQLDGSNLTQNCYDYTLTLNLIIDCHKLVQDNAKWSRAGIQTGNIQSLFIFI